LPLVSHSHLARWPRPLARPLLARPLPQVRLLSKRGGTAAIIGDGAEVGGTAIGGVVGEALVSQSVMSGIDYRCYLARGLRLILSA
jgi:hypothetical protein